ncbi:MAG TPA: trypsin-like peptidase domain-containing protein [Gemmataceae bacterium]|jgi:serine protease Do|nr:trypsin-like peptidase domain-containing protein [Gemmataceae bacterium]
MYRRLSALTTAVLMCWLVNTARADQESSLKEALALQEAVQNAIQQAEPAVACILVSRSEVYRKWFGQAPSKDQPGKLGGYDPATAELRIPEGDESQLKGLTKKFSSEKDAVERLKKRFDMSAPGYVPASFGSGVVINKNGLILTNYHVVRDATKLYVRLPGGKSSYADIHAADPRSDLAVLRVLDKDILPLRPIKRGDGGTVRKGQFVVAVSNPFAAGFRDDSPSASWGIVSNLRHRAPATPLLNEIDRAKITLHQYGALLQTDARLSVGCSGGALINLQGELVGLTTTLAALTGGDTTGGFAVPMDAGIRRIVRVLEKGEEVEYGFLGVRFALQRGALGDSVRLGQVVNNSPADVVGLKVGETIQQVGDMPIRDTNDLFLAVGTMLAGSEVRLKVGSFNGETRMVRVTLAKFYQPGLFIASRKHAFAHGVRVDYTSVLAQREVRDVMPAGVYVRDVRPGSQAEKAKLQEAVITHVNGRPVNDPNEFYREVERVDKASAALELTLGSPDGAGAPRTLKLN